MRQTGQDEADPAPVGEEQEPSSQHQSSQQWRVWAVIFSLLLVAFVLTY